MYDVTVCIQLPVNKKRQFLLFINRKSQVARIQARVDQYTGAHCAFYLNRPEQFPVFSSTTSLMEQ